MTKRTCPHCGKTLSPHDSGRHVKRCVANPEMLQQAFALIRELSYDGIICSQLTYNTAACERNCPHSNTLYKGGYSWPVISDMLGLELKMARRARQHEPILEEARRLSRELHDGQVAPSAVEWELYCETGVSRNVIHGIWGRWENFVKAAGLTPGSGKYYWQIGAERRAALDMTPERVSESDQAETRAWSLALKGCSQRVEREIRETRNVGDMVQVTVRTRTYTMLR